MTLVSLERETSSRGCYRRECHPGCITATVSQATSAGSVSTLLSPASSCTHAASSQPGRPGAGSRSLFERGTAEAAVGRNTREESKCATGPPLFVREGIRSLARSLGARSQALNSKRPPRVPLPFSHSNPINPDPPSTCRLPCSPFLSQLPPSSLPPSLTRPVPSLSHNVAKSASSSFSLPQNLPRTILQTQFPPLPRLPLFASPSRGLIPRLPGSLARALPLPLSLSPSTSLPLSLSLCPSPSASLSLSLPLSLYLCLSLSVSLSLCLSLSLPLSLSLSPSASPSVSLPLPLSLSLSLCLSLCLSLSASPSVSLPLPLSLPLSPSASLSVSLPLPLPLSLSLYPSLCLSLAFPFHARQSHLQLVSPSLRRCISS
ncbi:uncharacterized protein LOC142930094 [Petromyzon marinus]|uniref:uncharacterized protein LOC142930094 n=1 Tax=Petromyzon marinus TaxID=7757 RepID=UPI003F6F86F5